MYRFVLHVCHVINSGGEQTGQVFDFAERGALYMSLRSMALTIYRGLSLQVLRHTSYMVQAQEQDFTLQNSVYVCGHLCKVFTMMCD